MNTHKNKKYSKRKSPDYAVQQHSEYCESNEYKKLEIISPQQTSDDKNSIDVIKKSESPQQTNQFHDDAVLQPDVPIAIVNHSSPEIHDPKLPACRCCTNCGLIGHTHNVCRAPVTSYGILALSVNSREDIDSLVGYLNLIQEINQCTYLTCENMHILENFSRYKDKVKTLLIMRKHSLGYTEFVRGRYALINPTHIAYLFRQMTPTELEKIKQYDFDHLWSDVWGLRGPICKHGDYILSYEKYVALRETATIKLDDFIRNTIPDNDFPEWGIPKGRRERDESDIDCAVREFIEETRIKRDNFILFKNIKPIIENLIGTNGVKYRHIYYIALLTTNDYPTRSDDNPTQRHEIGDIGLFDIDTTLQKIRNYHTERRNLLFSVCINIMNFLIKKDMQCK